MTFKASTRQPRGLPKLVVIGLLLAATAFGFQRSAAEERATRRLELVRNDPNQLRIFLQEMPKGGDLHNHLAGAIYAESYLKFAVEDGLCVDRSTSALSSPPCDSEHGKPPASAAYSDPQLYAQLIDAFSMRHFDPGRESGHDHFFATFNKFYPAEVRHTGEMLAEARTEAARDHVQYLELMVTPEDGAPALGAKFGWNSDPSKLREQLMSGGMNDVVATGRKELDRAEAQSAQVLHCGTPQAEPGCAVTVRYLYQVLRGLPPEQVFAQILSAFETAGADPRVVGLNLVMPEDAYVPMHDFDLHMQMLDYLSNIYPHVPISLHAGELTPRLVPPEGLFHIRASIERGHARRIGHGVDVLHEAKPLDLLQEMAQKHVLVEICLTSNDEILEVRGKQHPLPEYLGAGVPVALATDDEGVSRSDMTAEFVQAVEDFHLSYQQLKTMVRNSIHFSFLPGPSLWQDDRYEHLADACAHDRYATKIPSMTCATFLHSSAHAQEEWRLEKLLDTFEAGRINIPPLAP